jgi:hypothetical protein
MTPKPVPACKFEEDSFYTISTIEATPRAIVTNIGEERTNGADLHLRVLDEGEVDPMWKIKDKGDSKFEFINV